VDVDARVTALDPLPPLDPIADPFALSLPKLEGETTGQDAFTYATYLKIADLLALQQCVSIDTDTGEPEHDETLFIIIHQVYELWFKQLLHELDWIMKLLNEQKINGAKHHLKRVLRIMETLVGQIDVLETMTPVEFASFRKFLANASGFQSAQFRELEFVLGIKDRVQLDWFTGAEGERLARRHGGPTLWDAFINALPWFGVSVPASAVNRDIHEPITENPELQTVLLNHFDNEGLAGLCETLTDLDERLQEWRYRHMMMVRRTIGTQPGTGGSDGAAYLGTTLFKPAFPDLWAIRTRF